MEGGVEVGVDGSDSGLDGLGVRDYAVVVGVFIVLVIMEECDGEGEGM